MTKEEATIMCLKGHIKDLEETINTLRQEPILDKIVAEIKQLDIEIEFIYGNRLGDVVDVKHKIYREDVFKIINKYKDEQSNGLKWILVSERLPEDYETVIASTDRTEVYQEEVYPEARYSKEGGWEWAYESGADYWTGIPCDVIAWMPLPKPYKKEQK